MYNYVRSKVLFITEENAKTYQSEEYIIGLTTLTKFMCNLDGLDRSGVNDLCFTHKLYPQATQKHILHINILVLLVIQIYFMCKLEEAVLIKVTKITSTINWAFVNNNIIMKPLHP